MTSLDRGTPSGYGEWLVELKDRIRQTRLRASLAVNAELIGLCWRIGRDILDRQGRGGWGGKMVERLAADLRAEFAETPATVLCDGDAGLWRLQHEVLPDATLILDWWHAAARFEHALQAARSLGTDTTEARVASTAVRGLERAKWRLRHGDWPRCRRRLAALCRWAGREVAGADKLRRRGVDLLGHFGRNETALAPYAARRRCGEPIATLFVESAVDGIIAWRMTKKQQMRWSRATVQPFPDVRTAVLNNTLEDTFRRRHPSFCFANHDPRPTAAAA